MSTGLAVISKDSFLALNPELLSEDIREAMDAVAEVETIGPGDLQRVKVPAQGGTKWTIEGIGGDEVTDTIEGVLVHVTKRGVLWPSESSVEGSKPVLVSYDLVTAQQVGPIPDEMIDVLEPFRIDDQTFNWKDLPYNQFGSSKNGSGKRCKEQRILYVLRKGDIYPMVIAAPPGSLKTVTDFYKKIPLQAKVPPYRCVVALKLQQATAATGEKYSKIIPSLVGVLSREDGQIVLEKYTNVLKKIDRDVDVDN